MWHSFHRTDLCGSRATSVSMGAVIAVCVAPEADCAVFAIRAAAAMAAISASRSPPALPNFDVRTLFAARKRETEPISRSALA
jgi:ethanolamine utilization microcompartment shell protein EutL